MLARGATGWVLAQRDDQRHHFQVPPTIFSSNQREPPARPGWKTILLDQQKAEGATLVAADQVRTGVERDNIP